MTSPTDRGWPSDERPRILGIAEASDPNALSGIPRYLFDAVARRFPFESVTYRPQGATRLALAAATFRPSPRRWRSEFHNGLLAHRVMSRRLKRRLEESDRRFDVALQVLGWVHDQPRPYVVYVDQTRRMAERGWPNWMPVERRQRGRVLATELEMYRGASHLFTMGASAAESLVEDYGVPPDQVSVVGGGVSFDPMPAVHELPTDPIILFVGKDFDRKGGEILIEAFRQVRQQVPAATLRIVGTGRRFRVPGVTSHGKIAGRAQIRDLYREARVFALPSFYEPYGLVLLEAMANGVPCVGAVVESIPWILDHGNAGRLVPAGDVEQLAAAIIELLIDDELARRLSAVARRRVADELTWDRVVDRMAPALVRISSGR